MANAYRAEANLYVAGAPVAVALTTAAVVELADALGVETFQALSTRLLEFRLKDLMLVTAALLKGNGYPVDQVELMSSEANPHAYADLISTLLSPPKGGEQQSPPKAPAKS